MPTPEYHARLGPSSSKRWLNCPLSVKLGEGTPERTSEAAEEGRLAHAIAELKALKKFKVLSRKTFDSQMKKLQGEPLYLPEIQGYTDTYIEVLTEHAMSFAQSPATELEQAVPIGCITGEKKEDGSPATGTADCIQIAENVLWITDFKYGKSPNGRVSAVENTQMMLYALGALELYNIIYGDMLQRIRLTIVQPRLDGGITDWEISRTALEAWGNDVVRPAAAQALVGEGEPNDGDWCQFCPARPACRKQADNALALEEFKLSLPPLLSNAEVGDVLIRGEPLVAWYNTLKGYAADTILGGEEIPGWKLVEGRGSRAWDDLDAAFRDLQSAGIAEALLWTREPVTPPALEKTLGVKPFTAVAGTHVVKTPGKPALARDSDKRPTYNAAAIAFGPGVPNG